MFTPGDINASCHTSEGACHNGGTCMDYPDKTTHCLCPRRTTGIKCEGKCLLTQQASVLFWFFFLYYSNGDPSSVSALSIYTHRKETVNWKT